ncbi:hypothetical protein HCG68_01890 [Paeniclostridium sordellii]|nr:hypothetical protein [Paeniclostridium sordellii]
MGKVITINYKEKFYIKENETLESIRVMRINKEKVSIKTTVALIRKTDEYSKYKIEYFRKTNVDAMYDGKSINYIFRRYNTYAFVEDKNKYVLTVGNVKGIISRQSFDKLKKDTDIKCNPVKVDLLKAIELLISSDSSITIDSGWFSNLGTNLSNAWLQGRKVNDNSDWERFKKTKGSKLKNIELRIEDDSEDEGYIKVSISSRGFLFTKKQLSDEKCLQITKKILRYIESCITIEDNVVDDEELEKEDEVASTIERVADNT